MKIVIAGAGAMGCLFAGLLAQSGHELWLLEKDAAKVNSIRCSGITIESDSSEPVCSKPAITAHADDSGIADLLVLLVKAYDTEQAVQASLPAIGPHTTVLTLQNGLGNIEAISRCVPQPLIVAGTTAHGATLLGSGRVRHAGRGETVIGPLVPEGAARAHALQEIFQSAGIPVRRAEDIQPVLWGKLLVNVGINALTAIMGVKNGRVGDVLPLYEVMRRCVAEGAAVAQGLGITLPYPDPVMRTAEICSATAENLSSMHQDICWGRRTEIENINGIIVAYGSRLGIATPVNRMLTLMVQSLEFSSLRRI
jgi:2-dehydropantoate 2-reductase